MTSATEPRLVRPPRTNWPAVHDGRGQYVVGGANVSMATEKRKARVAQIQLFSNLCHTYVMEDLSEEHQALYTWIDEIPLSRQKKHVARDFSDGGKLHKHDKQTPMGRTELLFQNILFAEA